MLNLLPTKRINALVDFESPQTKKKKEPISLFSQIVLTADPDRCCQNAVWMHREDIYALYPSYSQLNPSQPKLVKLANSVYHLLEYNFIKQGNILINPLQNEEIRKGIFKYNNQDCIYTSALDMSTEDFESIDNIVFEFQLTDTRNTSLTVELSKLRKQFQKVFDQQIITNNQHLYFYANGITFDVIAKFSECESKYTYHKRISDNTHIDFISKTSLNILDGSFEIPKNKKVTLKVLSYKTLPDRKISFPQLLNANNLKTSVYNLLKSKSFLLNETFHLEWQDCIFEFRIDKLPKNKSGDNDFKYQKAYKICEKLDNFVFTLNSDLKNAFYFYSNSKHASCLEVEVTKARQKYDEIESFYEDDQYQWVSIEELREALKKRKEYLPNFKFTEKLKKGKYNFQIKDIAPWISIDTDKQVYPPIRTYDSATTLKFFTNEYLQIVDHDQPCAVSKLVLKVKHLDSTFSIFDSPRDLKLLTTSERIEELCRRKLANFVFHKKQFSIECQDSQKKKTFLQMTVEKVEYTEKQKTPNFGLLGKVSPETEIEFKFASEEKISFGSNTTQNSKSDKLKMEELEQVVGGVSKQLKTILRQVILSRGSLREEFERRGLKPIKGMLLYGPPGTGKTTLARNIGKVFGCTEGERFQLLNASELTDKYVGQTEKRIRELFQPAEKALLKEGGENDLHIIVIDEAESILATRQSNSDHPWTNSWVNQFLGKLDGLKEVKNVFVIIMSNRKDIIDGAILRPGRIELHVELGLPDFEGRKEIFDIHLKTLKKENLLHNIDMDELADLTKEFSGADIEGIVKVASSYSLERLSELGDEDQEKKEKVEKVTMEDFKKALEAEHAKRKNNEKPDMYM